LNHSPSFRWEKTISKPEKTEKELHGIKFYTWLLRRSREGIKATGQASGEFRAGLPLPIYQPQQIMKSISTSLSILFGFAIFVNVVATPADDALDGCPITPIL